MTPSTDLGVRLPEPVLDHRPGEDVPETEFIEAAMRWHFDPDTGSPFWLRAAEHLDFDPRRDVHGVADLARFPNLVDQLRDVPAYDLVPRGYGRDPGIAGVYDSGGTTGPPKRVVFLDDWFDWAVEYSLGELAARRCPIGADWLAVVPSGPHMFGAFIQRLARRLGRLRFTIDLDPRWVKRSIAEGRADEADRYADHLIDQARHVLATQDIRVMVITPPLLERLARHDDLVELVNAKVKAIEWGGAHLDADTRYLFLTEVFPGIDLYGRYGSTMILGGAVERPGLAADDPCVFDPPAPYITFWVVDPDTRRPVEYGARGQVVMNHVSRSALLPNNLERDVATRVEPPPGSARVGDSVADVAPVREFGGETVVEGVY
ncbi:phenazine antibiotic biosynthesis protein [Frankia sp. CNm7]|uniref:Phenazine antibiotic biosynthesis protein n=1 Tax=Frankia nepalensis TaxID=1836974 RepID=A0A937UPW3_9ACTN|nr:phenazine antibiotic biosynthesis protein [Frankia nepalensis]MBL7495439.1 phenazine antibiotic biosynthesis protein [Frankia nepalensis]MBL7510731.1 phenazine antibiotic biosynthesis protein [Frankia nepalensis]MBL7522678.1 phenazine antibiotic biosynthesis protein [Frankia nepalensis]MBL7625996.1 phenazine antibiotic biosynthesis protein [Frankia nepalensis]